MDSNAYFGIAAVIGALGVAFGQIVTAMGVHRNARAVEKVARQTKAVHDEVKTSNGRTIAKLADLAEGRRVIADVPADDRTPGEAHAVALLNEPDAPNPEAKP
jgi:hypothetical protein